VIAMLDYRHQTFLEVYRLGSYTRAAEALNLTQPAVSQHIRALEKHYGCRLFVYANRALTPTEQGRLLYQFASRIAADSDLLTARLRHKQRSQVRLRFGATLTIGQYILPVILQGILRENPGAAVSMLVENTQHLLTRLERGDIQFALIEGLFDKTAYHWELLAREPFIGVCAPGSIWAEREASLEELLGERLIVREKGSGTREILEHLLHEHSLSIASFAQVTEIGSMEAIKQLVQAGLGITFVYQAAVRKELAAGDLRPLALAGWETRRELNFVFLKHSQHAQDYLHWFQIFQEGYRQAFPGTC
jgi:DNA-binding transcriptional LysR family regulator